MQAKFWSFERRLVLALSLTLFWLMLAALWVPISMEPVGYYREANLLVEIKPRALVNTIAILLNLSNWGFNAIKIGALFLWLALILITLSKQLLRNGISTKKYQLINYIALSFIFAWSTVTFMTYAPVAILDIVPFCLVLVATLICQHSGDKSWSSCAIVALLLLSATSAHEKTIFDIAILVIWFSWKWGVRRVAPFFLPTMALCGLFLWSVQSKETSGLSTISYLAILQSGLDFMLAHSYHLTSIFFGGGALWGVYVGSSIFFIADGLSIKNKFSRSLLCTTLLSLCLAPLLVSWDTNRLVDLIWLPTFLIISELKIEAFSRRPKSVTVVLLILCCLQAFIPPLLRTNDLVFAFNRYAIPYANQFKRENFSKESLIPAGESLLFSKDGLGARTLAGGWNDQEPWGIWSQGNGRLAFNNLGAGIGRIQVEAKALIGPKQATQFITVLVNQKPIQTIAMRSKEANTFIITLPAVTRPGEPLSLEFQIHNPSTPIQAGISSVDNRVLGIGLIKLNFLGPNP